MLLNSIIRRVRPHVSCWTVFTRQQTAVKYEPRFYFPETTFKTIKGLELWRLIIKTRDREQSKALTSEEKATFYKEVKKSLEKALLHIMKVTMPLNSLEQVAQVAAQTGDIPAALQVTKAFDLVGAYGLKMVIEGGHQDQVEATTGFKLSDVYLHPLFIMTGKGTDVFRDGFFCLHKGSMDDPDTALKYLNYSTSKGKPLIFITNKIHHKVLHLLVQKRLTEKIKLAVVELHNEILTVEDLSTVSGAGLVSDSKEFSEANMSPFGSVYIRNDEVLFLNIAVKEQERKQYMKGLKSEIPVELLPGPHIRHRPDLLWRQKNNSPFLRLQKMNNMKVALIKAGGRAQVDRIQRMGVMVDALGKAESAVDWGLIPAGGRALLEIAKMLSSEKLDNTTEQGRTVVIEAIKTLYTDMFRAKSSNSVPEPLARSFMDKVLKLPLFFSYDPSVQQYINLIDEGDIDTSKELIHSLFYAVNKSSLYEKKIKAVRVDHFTFNLFDVLPAKIYETSENVEM